jgi:deoxyribodipyrimidine photo-lyase
MKKLSDADLASNNGGWQWSASTGTDAQPYFRIFNPIAQAERFDPEGEYIHRYVPEVESRDYPAPVVDHGRQRLKALALFKG